MLDQTFEENNTPFLSHGQLQHGRANEVRILSMWVVWSCQVTVRIITMI